MKDRSCKVSSIPAGGDTTGLGEYVGGLGLLTGLGPLAGLGKYVGGLGLTARHTVSSQSHL